ncbi:MAG: hypothetical protein DUD39_16705 [Coriobacteriaceae bacterium]|nr:MAG: hypothetical protein DUD39_16705 [Coriobacteriaceae bacterium]
MSYTFAPEPIELPRSMARHRRMPRWSWQAHLLPHTGQRSASFLYGLAKTTMPSVFDADSEHDRLHKPERPA